MEAEGSEELVADLPPQPDLCQQDIKDIFHTSTSPSPLSQDFTIAHFFLLAFSFCPSAHSTPLPSLHLLPLEDTLQIFLTVSTRPRSPCLTLPLQLQPLTETSVSHPTPHSHRAALAIPIAFYLLLSNSSAIFPSAGLSASQPASSSFSAFLCHFS